MSSPMTQGERIRRIQEEANTFLSRQKTRVSSEITMMRQAKASSTSIPTRISTIQDNHTNQIVPPYQWTTELPANATVVGPNTDSLALLRAKENCAVCTESTNTYILRSVPCYDRLAFPFIQTDLTTPVSCSIPGFNQYFPPQLPCQASTNSIVYPS